MATTRRLRSSAASPAPSCMTTPRWQSPASWAMGSGSERVSSRSSDPTICSRTGSAGRARGTTRARSRDWSAYSGGTSWSPSRCRELRGPQRCSRLEQCRRRQAARLRGHKETIGERLERDRASSLAIAASRNPYDACDKRPGRASSLSLVRYRSNDYSVPVAYGHREVLIRGYVDEVVISCGRRGDRPAPPVLRQRGPDLRPAALPALDRAEDQRPRPGRAIGGLGPARGLHHSAAAPTKLVWARQASASTSRCCVYWRASGSRRSRVHIGTPCGSARSALMR